MIARIRKSMENRERGFTLVELLVVVVIIGILAAIAIPAFLRQRESAWAAQVESSLKNASTAAEAHSTTNGGLYTGLGGPLITGGTVATAWADGGFTATENVTIEATLRDDDTAYQLVGEHESLDDTFTYDSETGVIERN